VKNDRHPPRGRVGNNLPERGVENVVGGWWWSVCHKGRETPNPSVGLITMEKESALGRCTGPILPVAQQHKQPCVSIER